MSDPNSKHTNLWYVEGIRQLCKLIVLLLQEEWRYYLAGGTQKPKDLPNPGPEWLSERSWGDILTIAALPKFTDFADDFQNHVDRFQAIFDSPEPHRSLI